MATAVFGIRTRAAGATRLEWRVFLRSLADVDIWRGALDGEEIVAEAVPERVNLDLAEFDRLYPWGHAPVSVEGFDAPTPPGPNATPPALPHGAPRPHPMWSPKKRPPAKHADGRDKTYHIRRAATLPNDSEPKVPDGLRGVAKI